jgi:dipeptidyl aminopeptidase/acylaminoacyl peptidase
MSNPYALWPSSLNPETVAAGARMLAEPRVGGDALYWLAGLPEEGGRATIMCKRDGQSPQSLLASPYNGRSCVNEYGGGAYTVTPAGEVWFVNGDDQALCRLRGESIERVFQADDFALGDLVWDATHERIVGVGEATGDAPRQMLVAIDAGARLQTLAEGADFYAAPRLSPDGQRLVWLEWSNPDMPWDATRLIGAEVRAEGTLHNMRHLAGESEESLAQPEWGPRGNLFVVSDRTDGFWNLHRVTESGLRAVHRSDAECARPAFQFAQNMVAFQPGGGFILAEAAQGVWRVIESREEATPEPVLPALTDIACLDAGPAGTAVLGAGPATPLTLYFRPAGASTFETVASSLELTLDPGFVSEPRTLEFQTGDGERAYGLYFPPAHPDRHAETPPPVRVRCHGGPTAAASSALDPKTLYWTSRGWGFLQLNYRGSTGFGRAFRKALYGRWGEADAEDARAAAWELVARGLADPERLTIAGSSAGGLTVLNALVGESPYAAGASLYGVADLTGLVDTTHRFEAHYGDTMIAPWPAGRATYEARSPLNHAAEIARPVIFFQGLDDKVVPPAQSEHMAHALAKNELPVVLETFAGESHGFKKADTIARTLAAELAFHAHILQLEPAETLPELTYLD